MPVNDQEPAETKRRAPPPSRRRHRFITRRNAIIVGAVIVLAAAALIIIALLSYRLGYVDAYIAGQVKNTLANYGIRAEIQTFRTTFNPQTVEVLGLELYDAQTGEKLGKIDRLLATVRIEDLYALNLRRNINLKDLQVEGLELWVNFDEQGRSNFRNLRLPPPEPNRRILFAYSTAHIQIKNALIHYGDALHSLSGEARNLRATIQPDDPNAPAQSWMNAVTLSATNSTFAYDGRPINNIDIEARGRVSQTRAEIQELTIRSPVAEAKLTGVMDDWRALKYNFNVTSTVDLTQLSDVLATGTALRGVGNFTGTITGEGEKYRVDGAVKADALAADGIRLQGLHVAAKGSGQGESYNFNGRAVAQLLSAGNFQLNAVQLTGGVIGTGTDFRWVGELQAAAEKSYGTTITGLILRDAMAEYRDGLLTASAPQLIGSALTTATTRAAGIQANDIRMRSENGVTTATVATASAGKILSADATIDGVTARNIAANSRGDLTNVTIQEVEVGAIHAAGAQTGSINIAGVRLAVRSGRVQGATNDINAGTVKLENGQVENVKLAGPSFTLEPSGRYRASADLSLGGGVLGEMRLGPARAAVAASNDRIELRDFVAEALDGRASGDATIALAKTGTSRVSTDFNNFDLRGIITVLSGRVVPVASRATGRAEMTFAGTDPATGTGTVNAQLQSAAAADDLVPLSGDVAVTADRGVFQIQRANVQTTATRLSAAGQFSIEEPVSNLTVKVASTDASEIQRLLITSGALSEIEQQFETYNIALGGKLNFDGALTGALKDPLVSGRAELGSLIVNRRDLGSLNANIASTPTETRIENGRLLQPNGGGAQFALVIPRLGQSNTSIEATLDRMDAGNLITALPETGGTPVDLSDTEGEASGSVKIDGIPNKMTGRADLRFGKGKLAGEPLQNLTARATFTGSTVNIESVDANFDGGHIVGNGKYDTKTQAFEVTFGGDRVQLDRLAARANRPGLPKLGGIAKLNGTASGIWGDLATYQINFNGESSNVTIDGRPAGELKLVGVTENKQLNITFSTTGLLGDQAQTIVARVDLSSEKLATVIESNITGADLTQLLRTLLPDTEVAVSGRATGTLKLSGNLWIENEAGEEVLSWRGLTGSATFTELTVSVAEVQLAPTGPLVIDFAPNEISFRETRFTGPGTNVTVGGTIATGPGGRQSMAVNGDVNLRVFSGISPDVFSSGVARMFLRVTGSYEDPRFLGTAEVAGASVSVFSGDQTITISNLTGLIRFNSNQAQIERLTGTLGGGRVTASGGALLAGDSRGRFAINVRGENVTLSYPKDFRSTVTADLSLTGDMTSQFVSGYVNVKRTEYTKEIDLADLINQRPETTIEEGGRFSFAETAVLSGVRVEGRNALVMRNNLGDVVASVNLRLDGPIGDPIIQGRVTATSGTLNFRNSPYELRRGLVDFPGRLSADPILNIEGESVIRGYRVRAAITGPLSNPQTTVSSEPALPQADVVSLILTGSLASGDQSTSVLAQSGLGTAASLLTDALINAPVSRATNRLFGLNRLEINPVIGAAGSTPTARLTVGRRISKDVTITYSTNLASDPNQILAVEYRVSNRLSFIAQYEQGSQRNLSNRNNNYSFEIRFRKRF